MGLSSCYLKTPLKKDSAFTFKVQVHYAVGDENLGEGKFELRTMYNFRHRLSAQQCWPNLQTYVSLRMLPLG